MSTADSLVRRKLETNEEKEEFIKSERESFHQTYDKDKDGRLNMVYYLPLPPQITFTTGTP